MAHDFQRNMRHNPAALNARNKVEHSAHSLLAKSHMDHSQQERQAECLQEWPDSEFSSSESEYDSPIEEDMYEEPRAELKPHISIGKLNSAEMPSVGGGCPMWQMKQRPGHEDVDTAEDSYIQPIQPPQVIRSTKPRHGKDRGIGSADQRNGPSRPLQKQDFRPPLTLSSHPASNPVIPRQGFTPTLAKQDAREERRVRNPIPSHPKVPKKPPIPTGMIKPSHPELPPPVQERDRPKIGQTHGRKSDEASAITQYKPTENSDYEVMHGENAKKSAIATQLPALIPLGGDKVKLKPTNGPIKIPDVNAQESSSANLAPTKNGVHALTDSLNKIIKLRNKNDLDSQIWFTNSCDRANAVKALERVGKNGAFLVRKSAQSSRDQPYTLSLLYKGVVYNLRIRWMEDASKYALGKEKAGEETFDSVVEMMENYHKTPLNLISSQQGEINKCKLEHPVKLS